MSDYADFLVSEQSNPMAALLEILVSDYVEYDLVAALEGPDDKVFYFDFMRAYLPGKSILYLPCGGKSAVLGLKDLVEQYEWAFKPVISYMCDKDFDDYLECMLDGIYYTPFYSIESYFVTDRYADYVLEKHSRGILSPSQRETIRCEYNNIMRNLIKQVRPIAALMIELRSFGLHPDFDELSVSDLFDLSTTPPKKRADRLDRIRHCWCGDAVISLTRLRATARRLRLDDYCLWLRGKLGLQLARVAFRLALKRAPSQVQSKAPDAAHFAADWAKHARQFLVDIATLKAHCEAVTRAS